MDETLQTDGNILALENMLHSLDAVVPFENSRRSQGRSLVSAAVTLRLASTSQRAVHLLSGWTKNVSTTGCAFILNQPPYVGDIYRIEANQESPFVLSGACARCIRCQLIDEDVFEAGFQLLMPLSPEMISDGVL